METAELERLTLEVHQSTTIAATPDEAFAALLHRLSEGSSTPDGQPMPMRLECWPGGRWYRDLGDDVGHLWGFVQVIKPPCLLEVHGPMFMSYPVTGHIQFRVEETDGGVELTVHHRAIGLIEDAHREGVVPGWRAVLDSVKSRCEGAA